MHQVTSCTFCGMPLDEPDCDELGAIPPVWDDGRPYCGGGCIAANLNPESLQSIDVDQLVLDSEERLERSREIIGLASGSPIPTMADWIRGR